MSMTAKQALLILSLGVGILSSTAAFAYTPESELLKIKGYSPEVIRVADMQRSRQEWREPSTLRQGPVHRFFHNLYYGDWTENIDDFGLQVLRDQ